VVQEREGVCVEQSGLLGPASPPPHSPRHSLRACLPSLPARPCLLQFTCQQINCTRDSFGNVVDGKPDEVHRWAPTSRAAVL